MACSGRIIVTLGFMAAGLAGCSHLDTAGFPPLAAASRHDVETRLNMARLHERQGQLAKARDLYHEIWSQDRANVVACHRLGVVMSRLGQHEQALQFFTEARRLEPTNNEILTDLGYAFYIQNDFARAEQYLREAVRLSPRNQRATNNLALVVGHQGRSDESLALFRRAVGEAEANANVAYIHLQRGEGDQAAELYSRSLSLDSKLKSSSHALVQIAELKPEAGEPARLHVAEAKPVPNAKPASPIQLASAERDVAAIVGNNPSPPDDLPPGESLASTAAPPPALLNPAQARPAVPAKPAPVPVPTPKRFPIPVRRATPAPAAVSSAAPTRMQATAGFSTRVADPSRPVPAAGARPDLTLTSTVVRNPHTQSSAAGTGTVQTGGVRVTAAPTEPGPVITPGPVRRLPTAAVAAPRTRVPFGIEINPGPRAAPPPAGQ